MSQEVKMEWLMDNTISDRANVSLARMTVPVGVTSECHRHSNCTETIHVVSGQIWQRIGEDRFDMGLGDTCLVPMGEAHQTENVGDAEAVMMVCYSAGKRDYERVG